MKKGVKIAIIIGIIVVIVVAALLLAGFYVKNNMEQSEQLDQEIMQIEEMTAKEDFDLEALKEKTEKIVTQGEYAKVEIAVKRYIFDLYSETYNLKAILEDNKITQLLTIDNFKEDGPDFAKTKEYLSTTKQKIEESKNKMLEYANEEKMISYIKEQNVNKFFEEMYNSLIKDSATDLKNEQQEFEEAVNEFIEILNKQEAVIDYLIQNKQNWKIIGQQIIFSTEEQVNAYTELINKLQEN